MVLMVRHFRASPAGPDGEVMWFAEYDSKIACRQFEAHASRILVAPYDIPFLDLDHPVQDPNKEGVKQINLGEFELAWEQLAQQRLGALSQQATRHQPDVRYFRAAVPSDASEYGVGIWYAEFAAGIARRQFEMYQDRTLVAPYDIQFADQFGIVETDNHYEEIALTEFEAAWNAFAAKRLREIARIAP